MGRAPTKKTAPKKAAASTTSTTAKPKTVKATGTAKKASKFDFTFLEKVHLPGEEKEAVIIYDDCNEIRRKIRAFFKDNKVTQRSFCEHIGGVSPATYQNFMKKSGPLGGGESKVYYYGYVFFEKLRIHENKKKTKKREENEKKYPKNGFPRCDPSIRGIFMHESEIAKGITPLDILLAPENKR